MNPFIIDRCEMERVDWYTCKQRYPQLDALLDLKDDALQCYLVEHVEYLHQEPVLLATLYTSRISHSTLKTWFAQCPQFESLRQDLPFARSVAVHCPKDVVDWNPTCASDPAVVLYWLRHDVRALLHVPAAWLKQEDFVIECVRHHKDALKYLPQRWRSNREVMFAAIIEGRFFAKQGAPMCYLSEQLREDRAFMERLGAPLVKGQRFEMVKAFPERYLNDAQVVLDLVRVNSQAVVCAGASLVQDKAFWAQAAQIDPGVLHWAPPKVRSDVVFMVEHGVVHQPNLAYRVIGPGAKMAWKLVVEQGIGMETALQQCAQLVCAQRQAKQEQRVLRQSAVRPKRPRQGVKVAAKQSAMARAL